jgi:hypothetical protein
MIKRLKKQLNKRKSEDGAINETPQYQSFVRAAKELGCDDDEHAFEKRLKQVASSPPPKPDKPKRKKNPAK